MAARYVTVTNVFFIIMALLFTKDIKGITVTLTFVGNTDCSCYYGTEKYIKNRFKHNEFEYLTHGCASNSKQRVKDT